MKPFKGKSFIFSLLILHISFTSAYPQADLATGSFTNFNATAGEGGTFLTTYFSVTNQGNMFADSSWVGFYISTDSIFSSNDILLGEQRMVPLEVGGYASLGGNSLQLPSTLTSGKYWIIYYYDSRKNIAESNENNNTEVQKLTIQPPVFDFSLELKPDIIYSGFPIGVTHPLQLRCINNGNAQAPIAPISVFLSSNQTFDASDQKIIDYLPQGSGIPKGSSIGVTLPFTIPANTPEGNFFLFFIVDYDRQYTEGSESNNLILRSVTLQSPKVDLRITGISPWKDTLTTGIYRNFGFHYIDNKGNVTAKNAVYTMLLSPDTIVDASDVLIKSGIIDSLGIGDDRTGFYFDGFIPASIARGNYYYLFQLELKDGFTEANGKDNLFKKKLFIKTDSITLPGYFVETGTLTQNDCFANPIKAKSCNKKFVYTSSYAGTNYNHTCYFNDIVEIESENTAEGLNIAFEKFNVFSDTISIYDNNQLIGNFTGTTSPGPLYSKNGRFRIARMKNPFVPIPNAGYGFIFHTVCGQPLGIPGKKKVEASNFLLYPNPSYSNVQIQYPEENGILEVMDMFGNVIDKYQKAPNQLEISHLRKGAYLIRWSLETFSSSKLLIVL